MPTRDLRFAFDEKGIKSFAPSLVGQTMTYWEDDRHMARGRVTASEVKRDRYGNPYIEVEIEPLTQAAAPSTGGEKSDGAETPANLAAAAERPS
jgi:hypothetical protein